MNKKTAKAGLIASKAGLIISALALAVAAVNLFIACFNGLPVMGPVALFCAVTAILCANIAIYVSQKNKSEPSDS